MIELRGLTKRYRNGRGIFDLTFDVGQGEVFGYLGPNGAGKSTTISHLMGFLRPDSGVAKIGGLDCWHKASVIQQVVGYLPGEITFLEGMSGRAFLTLLAGMRKLKHLKRRDELLDLFELDDATPIRKMSKGTKQKLGIVAAFMHQPDVLILDEPTSGLDPLMQQRFLSLILEERQRGATILMSSHNFSEVERVCDRVGIVREGTLVTVRDIAQLRAMQRKVFTVVVRQKDQLIEFQSAGCEVLSVRENEVDVQVQGDYNAFAAALSRCDVVNLRMHELSLEQVFMHFYHDNGSRPSDKEVVPR